MTIDVKDTIQAIRDMVPILDPEEDYLTIAAAEERMSTTEALRKKELEETHMKLRALAGILDAARKSSSRPETVPSLAQHAATINELDASRLSLAKAINDAESALAGKEAELARLKVETQALEESDPAAEHELDATALRLAMYKGLGFEVVADQDGRVVKMLVRAQSGDVHCVDFRDDKSPYEHSHNLWKLASS
ncbi:hypothetical protein EUX98_g343 [Antrodiella citrinella]|uniref:Kinetochore protein Spc24 n=1 Tax=Antrodiella citrinella TaxID=2447956 RepID=A0A4S4N4D9_9APHY|nr:hypothetical protein EUX98_g343 [Antrodiella citrinella]